MHKKFLLAALKQAFIGRGYCAPNPSVGAVAVQNNKIIAQGYHQGVGTLHAEQEVINQLSFNENVTLYVTLEPCNHWGRTPPCVEAIIQAGIQTVVYAYRDPNPLVAKNNTPALLAEAGVEVIHFPLDEINRFYQSYHYWIDTKKPWVTVKMAQTLDGKIAKAGDKRTFLSNELCHRFTHQQRHYTDIILTTAKTVNQDNPLLNVRLKEVTVAKTVAIIDEHLLLNNEARVLSTARHCHIFHHYQQTPLVVRSNCTYHAIEPGAHGLDLVAIINRLGALGYHDVWVEAGGHLFSALHQEKLVQRTHLYLVPRFLGPQAQAGYVLNEEFNQDCTIQWQPMADNMIVSLDWRLAAEESRCLQV